MSTVYDKSLLKSFGYSVEGIIHAFKFNRNLRIASFFGVIVIGLSLYLQVTYWEMIVLIITILIVIICEMMNASIEEMVNLITNEHKKEAKIAKDVAAGMVLVAAMGSVIIGLLIFIPYVLK